MHRIVILGGGYAGVTTAVRLEGVNADITLVNAHSYHHLTTLLHQPAVGNRRFRDLSVYLDEVLPPPVKLVRGQVRQIVAAEHKVIVYTRDGERSLPYDTLVVALGWEPSFFNIPGLERKALTLKSLTASRLTRDHIDEALSSYDEHPDQAWRKAIVIGGGGLTGVELAGELAEAREDLGRAFDLRPEEITVALVNGSEHLLKGLEEWLGLEAGAYLQHKGVRLVLGSHITEVADDHLTLASGEELPAGVVIWAGGVRANGMIAASGLATGQQGRAIVNTHLQAQDQPDVFVIGDCALALDIDGQPLPPTAQLACQQGECVARNLLHRLRQEPLEVYRAKQMGIVLSLGRKHALGAVMGYRFRGLTAALLKDMIAYKYLYSIGGLRLTLRKFFAWLPYLIDMHHG